MKFYKYQANGNDFIITFRQDIDSSIAKNMCDRHTGVGADGLLNVDSFLNVTIFNADGTSALMCGNGLRCLSKLLYTLTNNRKHEVIISSKKVKLNYLANNNCQVEFDDVNYKNDNNKIIVCGNYHYIVFTPSVDAFILTEPLLQISYKENCNIHAIELLDSNNFKIRSFEYGVGETMSCGSGSIASFFLLKDKRLVNNRVKIHCKGGKLNAFFSHDKYYLEGKASYVYEGEYYGL